MEEPVMRGLKGFPHLEKGETLDLYVTRYRDNNKLALLGKISQTGEDYACFSVNVVEHAHKLKPNQTFIKTYSEGEGNLERLQKAGIIGPVLFWVATGFVTVPAVEVLVYSWEDPREKTKHDDSGD